MRIYALGHQIIHPLDFNSVREIYCLKSVKINPLEICLTGDDDHRFFTETNNPVETMTTLTNKQQTRSRAVSF